VGGRVHVTVPGRAGRARRPGIRIHRPRHFDETLVTVVDGIRVTTVERTLLDLRGSVPASVVRRAARQAEYMGILRDRAGSDSTRSDLERSFLALCRHHRIPRPEVNVQIGNYTVDFLWRSHGIVIETDGYAAHRGRQAFRDDRDRDLDLATLGLTVHRIADSRIANDPAGVAVIVRGLLKLSAPPTGGAPKAR
jgi:very-short-patch-repair endonuclease